MRNIQRKIILMMLIPCLFVACDPAINSKNKPDTAVETEADAQELQQQSEDFDKSIDELNEAMDAATILNEKIQLVEEKYNSGEFTRQRADALITALNEQYGIEDEIDPDQQNAYSFPDWAKELGLSEPRGLTYDGVNSYQTYETDLSDGYNSILLIYLGDYQTSLNEAARIAGEANIPMSETYQKASDLAKKLGKPIAGIKGMTYMNYRFDRKNDGQKYHISINVDANGKLSMTAVDVELKNARGASSIPNL